MELLDKETNQFKYLLNEWKAEMKVFTSDFFSCDNFTNFYDFETQSPLILTNEVAKKLKCLIKVLVYVKFYIVINFGFAILSFTKQQKLIFVFIFYN